MRCNNAGENKKLELMDNGPMYNLGLKFEYTARGTPQQNHLLGLKCSAIAGGSRAMMNRAHILECKRYQLFQHAAITATKLDWLVMIDIEGELNMRRDYWCGKVPKFARYLDSEERRARSQLKRSFALSQKIRKCIVCL